MKAIKDDTLVTIEDLAVEGAKQIRAYFTYQGDNKNYINKAKLGAAAIGGFARIRATENNRASIEAQAARSKK